MYSGSDGIPFTTSTPSPTGSPTFFAPTNQESIKVRESPILSFLLAPPLLKMVNIICSIAGSFYIHSIRSDVRRHWNSTMSASLETLLTTVRFELTVVLPHVGGVTGAGGSG